ncbi:hypothetical protein GW17_00018477 [Ensete ventricosum]|nr:hypothetical protein GW17_00018477 [Ensete ventricosum]
MLCGDLAMRARLGRLWDGSQVRSASSESKGRSGVASKSYPIRLVVAVFVALLVIVFVISNSTVSVTLDLCLLPLLVSFSIQELRFLFEGFFW